MVATGHPALRVATCCHISAELATRALKHTIYSNFGTYSPHGQESAKAKAKSGNFTTLKMLLKYQL
jgi:hypothetical protein